MNVLVVQSTVRLQSAGRDISTWVYNSVVKRFPNSNVEMIDVKSLGLQLDDEPYLPATQNYVQGTTKIWSAKVEQQDVIVFTVPEYNGSYPASFKNAVDHLKNEWKDKVVLVVAYSPTGATSVVNFTDHLFKRLGCNLVDNVQLKTTDLGFDSEYGVVSEVHKLPSSPYQQVLENSLNQVEQFVKA